MAHGLPPFYFGVVVRFGDRGWYAVPRPYSTGTVATDGTTAVTGTGTAWTSDMDGMVIEIDRIAGTPIDVLVNGRAIACGEVVVIDEEFGIRITEIVDFGARF